MTGGNQYPVEIDLFDRSTHDEITIKVHVYDNSLSRKWLAALENVLDRGYHLEKNYCFLGFVGSERDGWFILDQINHSIDAINSADLGYTIHDRFTMENTITDDPVDDRVAGRNIIQDRLNHLHRYFEDLQGVSGSMSPFYVKAEAKTRWHIRQLNLLCHEFESWALSYRKQIESPDWQRPSQLMCWLDAPRFFLELEDYELFGVETLNRDLGGVYMGVNKAVGKHHWEVFNDEGCDSRIDELTTSTLRSQTQGAADFDIEWGRNPGEFPWQDKKLQEFRQWLITNGFDPDDKSLTIGHPKIAQVDLAASFGTENPNDIWQILNNYLDVRRVRTLRMDRSYNYHWSDLDYAQHQIEIIRGK